MQTILYSDNDIFIKEEDDILICGFQNQTIIDKNISSRMIQKRIEISKGKSRYVLADCGKVKYWTMSSRNNDMKDHSYNLIKTSAVVLPNKAICSLWYLTTKVFPTPIKVEVFTNYDQAKKWLIKEKDKELSKMNLVNPLDKE